MRAGGNAGAPVRQAVGGPDAKRSDALMEEHMSARNHQPPFRRTRAFDRQAWLRIGIATAIAGGVLAGAGSANARTTRIVLQPT
jgi:hypothetical protein